MYRNTNCLRFPPSDPDNDGKDRVTVGSKLSGLLRYYCIKKRGEGEEWHGIRFSSVISLRPNNFIPIANDVRDLGLKE